MTFAVAVTAFAFCATGAKAAENFIILQSTTSTQNSGLLDAILPQFAKSTGIEVRVVAVGTGQAIKNARNGDGDVLLVHSRAAEEAFIAEGWGVERRDVMFNDFVIAGPRSDPAAIDGMSDVTAALAKIAAARAMFISRGDDSGTHKKERSLWAEAGIDIAAQSGAWYRETGSGMGASLNMAAASDGYLLADRATWLAFKNRANLKILVEGDKRLFNPYGIILVNPARHAHVKAEPGQAFIDWLTGPEGQTAIGAFKIDGRQLFFPGAK
jgi:tungstate transport system substrate-binding protein